MRELKDLIGPCGLRVFGNYAYQYYKGWSGDLLVREEFHRPIFVFCYDVERIKEKIRKIEGFEEVFDEDLEEIRDVKYLPYSFKLNALVLKLKEPKLTRGAVNLLKRIRNIRGVYGIEQKLAPNMEQEYQLLKGLRWYANSEMIGDFTKVKHPFSNKEIVLFEAYHIHQKPWFERKDLEERLEFLREVLVRGTRDKEIVSKGFLANPPEDFVVIENVRKTGSEPINVVTKHQDLKVEKEFLEKSLNY